MTCECSNIDLKPNKRKKNRGIWGQYENNNKLEASN